MPGDPIKEEKYVEGRQPSDEFAKGKDQITVSLGGTLTLILHQ